MSLLTNDYIIFLDFDGVLNHIGIKNEKDFLPEAIEVLNELHKKYQAKIVISSSWRTCYTMKDLSDLLKKHGCECEVIDKTAEYVGEYSSSQDVFLSEEEFYKGLGEFEGRNKEIIHYVKVHDIKHYVILDDLPFTNQELIPHCVTTCYFDTKNGGLRKHHLIEIEKIFSLDN